MLDLSTFIWIDDQYSNQNALPDSIGDRYLYANNRLFRAVRETFLTLGFRYSSDVSRLWRDYDNASLFVLQDILDEGVVPYRDNLTTLKRVMARNPSLTISENNLLTLVARNYLLHESAHCIAHHLLRNRLSQENEAASEFQFVRDALLCESFANALERLAGALGDADAQRLYYRLNSYVQYSADQMALLLESVALFGLRRIFQLALLAYLHVNLHIEQASQLAVDIFIDTVFSEVMLTRGERDLLGVLVSTTFTLRKEFLVETTPLFFRQFGCETQYAQLRDSAFSDTEMADFGVRQSLEILSCAVVDKVIATEAPILPNFGSKSKRAASTG